MDKRVSVFGGSHPKPGEPSYEDALMLGRLLGQKGYTVLTGGYIGTMEAVSRGASEGGGKVIGVTCDEIEAWRPVGPNAWVQEEIRAVSVRERLSILVDECDGAISLPGGIGTLTEICMMWNLMSVNSIPTRPLILVGGGWKELFETFYKSQADYIQDMYYNMLTMAYEVEYAVQMMDERILKLEEKQNMDLDQ